MNKQFNRWLVCLLMIVVVSALATSVWAAPQTIKYAIWDYSMNRKWETVIDAFQKENPDIKVEIIDISNAEYSDKMTVMLAAGVDIDVFAVKNLMDYGGYVNRNYLYPLDEFMKKDQVDLKSYGSAIDSVKNKHKLMAFPFWNDIYILYYNKDIFDQAGVQYPGNDLTWEEVRTIAKKLTRGEGNNKIWGFYLQWWRSQVTNPILPTTKTTLVDGTYDFLKPSYQLFLKMQNEDKSLMSLAQVRTTNTHYRSFFESGKVGMLYMGSWLIGSLLEDKKHGVHDVNWGIVKAPHWAGHTPGSSVMVLTTLGMNPKSSKKAAAWKFISFLGGEKGAKIFAKDATSQIPALRTPEVLNIYTSAEGFPAAGGKTALEPGKGALVVEIPPHLQSAAIERTLQEEHDLIMTGQKSLDQGIKDMERRVKQILEDD